LAAFQKIKSLFESSAGTWRTFAALTTKKAVTRQFFAADLCVPNDYAIWVK